MEKVRELIKNKERELSSKLDKQVRIRVDLWSGEYGYIDILDDLGGDINPSEGGIMFNDLEEMVNLISNM